MKISTIIDEKERRVAVTPETVKKYIGLGLQVVLPENIGVKAGFPDDEYASAGAVIAKTKFVADADFYVCIKPSFLAMEDFEPCFKFDLDFKFKAGSHLIGILSPFQHEKSLEKLSTAGVNCYALELIPRITRAQSMDVLSSQSNIAGYRAVLEALHLYGRVVPLMMTAAGTVRPAKILVLGAGVAGLQAIATAKRLGAVVSAFDVRSAAQEQVESLGATFISVEASDSGETAAGYAKEMDDDYKKRQAEKLAQTIAKMDIVITTAQIPGKPAPRLVDEAMVKSMKSGSVIVDMATESGGNCAMSKKNEVVQINGVSIIGYTDLAAGVAQDASQLFARNAFNFVALMIKDGNVDTSDAIVQATLLKKLSGA
ncbi:MAG: Re/Si-specific NAD(P)(+) transhydrogenase subunit alpha [Holosporaceae bacterium]|nr:Re/Si-specific NAD(P)(+) transhydrogenase subunit alpha [Holosporaceae bacterium]